MAKSNRFTIYLCRDKDAADDVLIKEPNTLKSSKLKIPKIDTATLFVKNVIPQTPAWADLFVSFGIDAKAIGKGSSPSAVLIVRLKKATFLLTFGHGRHMLFESQIQRDFGLRVALNSIDEDKLRSIDKASHQRTPLNSRTQASKSVDIFELAIDTEFDLLTAITGSSKVEKFGAQVTGRDALSLNVKANFNDLASVLVEAHTYFNKTDYQRTFPWVDNFRRVRAETEITKLDKLLLGLLKEKTLPDNCWLAEPEIIDSEAVAFYILEKKSNKTCHFPELRINKLISILNERHKDGITIDILRNHYILPVDDNLSPIKQWSAYNCFYTEIKDNEHIFILQNGNWYELDKDFVGRVDAIIKNIKSYSHALPLYDHEDEGQYNEHAAKLPTYFKMDKKNIVHGGGHSKIEHCDLVKDGVDLIHVKRGTGSSTLSHLFAQGEISAELFSDDEKYRKKVNDILSDDLKVTDISQRPDTKKYTVVYAIVSEKEGELKLPFFSKVRLKNATQQLERMGYNVALSKIDVTHEYRVKSKIKAAEKAKEKRLI